MYILTIGRAYPEKKTGMIGIFELEQAEALSAAGNKVIYAFSENRSVKVIHKISKFKKIKNNVSIYGRFLPAKGLPEKLFNKIKASEFKKLMKLITDENGIPDVIHIHFPLLTVNSEILEYLKTLGCKIICTEHWSKVQKKELSAERKKFLKEITEKSDAFICVSQPLKKSVIEITGTDKNIYVLPNMVSSSFFLREKKPNNKFTFAAVGRLVEAKGFDTVIKAFEKTFRDKNNVYLKIIGDGKLYNSLKGLINNLGMNENIEMTGFMENSRVAEILGESDCYVSGSVFETFGVPFIEAWVTGIPSIGYKTNPINEYFNESNGVLFDSGNVESLAEAMKKVYSLREKYSRKEISQTAVKNFSSEKVAEKIMEIIRNV